MNGKPETPLLLAAAFLAAAAGCGPGKPGGETPAKADLTSGSLHVELEEPGGVDRRFEPVRVGLPFPRGALARAENARVVLSDGREAISQRKVLSRWPDGSVRWLELRFEPSVAAGAVGRYRAEWGPRLKAAKVPKPLAASINKGVISIDTGTLRLSVGPAEKGGEHVLRAWLDRDGDGEYADEEGVLSGAGLAVFAELEEIKKGATAGSFRAEIGGREGTIEMEEIGPLHAVMLWRGWHAGEDGRKVCPFTLRIHAYRGRSQLRLVHTLVLSELPAESRLLEAGLVLGLETGGKPLAGRVLRQEVLGRKRYPDLAGFETRFRLLEAEKLLAEGTDRNYLIAGSERFRLTAALPRAAEAAPWEMRLEPKGSSLVAAFWPRWGADLTDARRPAERDEPGYLEFTRTESYERFCSGAAEKSSALGAARTHELWLSFEPPGPGRGRSAAFAAGVAKPLVAWPGAGWLERSGVFGRFSAGGGEDARGAARLAGWLASHQRERFGWLGLWDYGDYQTVYGRRGEIDIGARWWNWHGRWGWMQGRSGLCSALLVPWLASGEAADWETFRAAVEHNLDVDTVHAVGREAGPAGATHGPGAAHWAAPAALEWTYPAAWLDHYYLSGERRGLEALSALVGSLGGRTVADFGEKGRPYTADQAGYLRARLAAREAFGEGHDKATAAALNHFAGLSGRELGSSELWARSVAPALIRYHRLTGDATAARLIERGTRVYVSSRGPAGREGAVARNCFEACAYAWRLTGERYFLERGRQLAEISATRRAAGDEAKPPAEIPADLATDTREVTELGTLPYLRAALREAAEGK